MRIGRSCSESAIEIYIDISLRAATLLLTYKNDCNAALQICRKIVETDLQRRRPSRSFSTLIKAERYSEAITAYKRYADMLRNEFGLEPSSAVQEMARNMKRSLTVTSRPANGDLGVEAPREGAFICDRESFRSIATLEGRRISRSGKPLGSSPSIPSSATRASTRSRYSSTVQLCFAGDAVCQWSPGLILVLLSGIEKAGVAGVKKAQSGAGRQIRRCV